ncbi:hypothetical protein [Polyangium mundeleinium]|uniref:Cell surface protein n=1 Tax=Polyangium mundeleinium TaxID=2995306 RepID=A0ABT5EP51_9BACT|nr:hypothetical protein [Polyangium mundeleinium]MDC0742968.1 hypothetical protein [Polyangium mundeleinium]
MRGGLRILTFAAGALGGVGCGEGVLDTGMAVHGNALLPTAGRGEVVWARAFGDPAAYTHGSAVAVGPADEIVIAGDAGGTLDLGLGPIVSPTGEGRLFVAGLDPQGRTRFGVRFDNALIEGPKGMAVGAGGHVFVGGRLLGTTDFGAGPLGSSGDAFVLALTPDGKTAWARTFSATLRASVTSLAVDPRGNVVLAGVFRGTMVLGTNAFSGAGNIFLARLDPQGNITWSKGLPGMNPQYVRAVAVDREGHVVIAGSFYDSIDLGDGRRESAGDTDVFVAKFTEAGTLLHGLRFGGSRHDTAPDLALDVEGNAFLAGLFRGELDLRDAPLSATEPSLYLAKLDPQGRTLFARGFQGSTHRPLLAVDASGELRLGGGFRGTLHLGDVPLEASGDDVFLAKLTSDGTVLWRHGYGDDEFQAASSLAVDPQGNTLVIGSFRGTLDFGGEPLVGQEPSDAFITKLSP